MTSSSSSVDSDRFQFAEMNIRHTGNMTRTITMVRRAIRMGYDSIVINTDVGQLTQDMASLLQNYDIVAVRPADEQILQTFSRKGEFVDIITYEQASTSVSWLFKSKIIMQCINEGLTFEVTYADALKDSSQRREVLSNARQLMLSTRGGRGVVIASGAEAMIDIRAPYDAANIAVLFGIRPENARRLVSGNARKALLRAESRKTLKAGMLVTTVEEMPGNLVKRMNAIEKIMRIPEFRAQLQNEKDERDEEISLEKIERLNYKIASEKVAADVEEFCDVEWRRCEKLLEEIGIQNARNVGLGYPVAGVVG
ncbi:unnamed protein product [Gongylonema pulchrum]|uniref:Ribonuclease P protein subunit p30 n=1 Tax=Gongylonema pulchrum TaxID=637853 RepID=A0A183DTC4_9BILA|nr:unnamed protein product [Gongylonema pulchrum]